MADYRPPLDDIRFVLQHIVDVAALSDIDSVLGIVEEAGHFFEKEIAPTNRTGDIEGVRLEDGHVTTPTGFKEAYTKYVDAGWGAVPFDPEYGGGGFPWLVAIALQEMMTSANMSFSMAPLLTQGAIELLAHHASPEQRAAYLPKMITGEWTGTMNLTEPQAGSDVGAVRTKAVRRDGGTYGITGQKIFITFGEHDMTDNIVHLVLARTPDAPPGTKGISCFIVPKILDDGTRNAVTCVGIEHKLGIHASPTCVLAYEDATGYLIGDENAGMRFMFTMMNNARLSVGLQGLALGERALQDARAYAHERRQGRAIGSTTNEQSPIVDHADVRRMLLTMRSLVDAMRCLVYTNAEATDLARRGSTEHQELADLLTPITKGWCTDMGIEVTSLAIQIHGGMGFIEETGVAQHYRDARIPPIYEGTNGIQAMDLVGRKLPTRGGSVVKELLARMRVGASPALADAVDAVGESGDWLLERLAAGELNDAMAGSVPYLRMWGIAVGGWLLARAAAAAGDNERPAVSRFFDAHFVPQVRGILPSVTAGAEVLFAVEL
ncbi:MAG: 3-(methylsulfanyl)propanoyl-CoA dehydrogenase [Actinomycetota bacterium]|jgi:alkylation response protein AidB-like acyl-CoA dehydrogenase